MPARDFSTISPSAYSLLVMRAQTGLPFARTAAELFDLEEKRQLASNIRDALVARGGVWITADVYLRGPRDPRIGQDDRLRDFLAAHRVEEQKFDSWVVAEAFFAEAGFAIRRRHASGDDATRESWVVTVR